jgi:hypothetical protein
MFLSDGVKKTYQSRNIAENKKLKQKIVEG